MRRACAYKSVVVHDDGREQIMGFHLGGDLMGMEAISTGEHSCDVIALEDSETCEIPFTGLQQLACAIPALQHHLHRMMSREIGRDYGVMLVLGTMCAEERLAAFLLSLGQRYQARGESATDLNLQV